MIQRIQTVWLSLAVILSVWLASGDILQFTTISGEGYSVTLRGISSIINGETKSILSSVGLPFTLILFPVLAVVTIAMYRNVKLQKFFSLLTLAFSLFILVLWAYYWYFVSSEYKGIPVAGFKMAFPAVIVILTILARRGILNDEKLVKSYDRLR